MERRAVRGLLLQATDVPRVVWLGPGEKKVEVEDGAAFPRGDSQAAQGHEQSQSQ